MTPPTSIADILSISTPPPLRSLLQRRTLFSLWRSIFGALADELILVKIVDNTAFFFVSKFDAVRDSAYNNGEVILMDILTSAFKAHDEFKKMVWSAILNPPPVTIDIDASPAKEPVVEVELTAEEIASCKRKPAALPTPNIALPSAGAPLAPTLRGNEVKVSGDWDECKFCKALPAEETVCDICNKVKEREQEKLRKRIRRFYGASSRILIAKRKIFERKWKRIQREAEAGDKDAALMIRLLRDSYSEEISDFDNERVDIFRMLYSRHDYYVACEHYTGDNQEYFMAVVFYETDVFYSPAYHYTLYGPKETLARFLRTAIGKRLDDNDERVQTSEK